MFDWIIIILCIPDNSNVPSKSRRVIGKRNSNRKVKSARIKREVIESENGQDDEELVDANGKRTSLLKDYPWNCTVCDESGFSNAKVSVTIIKIIFSY